MIEAVYFVTSRSVDFKTLQGSTAYTCSSFCHLQKLMRQDANFQDQNRQLTLLVGH